MFFVTLFIYIEKKKDVVKWPEFKRNFSPIPYNELIK